jgi:hypothetical protein
MRRSLGAFLILFLICLSVSGESFASSEKMVLHGSLATDFQPVIVPGPNGDHIPKINFFIGDTDEEISHIVRKSISFTTNISGENYIALPHQKDAVRVKILQFAKNMRVNLIGYGAGRATAAELAVDLAPYHRIGALVTIAPTGSHPDFALIKGSVEKWVNISARLLTDSSTLLSNALAP